MITELHISYWIEGTHSEPELIGAGGRHHHTNFGRLIVSVHLHDGASLTDAFGPSVVVPRIYSTSARCLVDGVNVAGNLALQIWYEDAGIPYCLLTEPQLDCTSWRHHHPQLARGVRAIDFCNCSGVTWEYMGG